MSEICSKLSIKIPERHLGQTYFKNLVTNAARFWSVSEYDVILMSLS